MADIAPVADWRAATFPSGTMAIVAGLVCAGRLKAARPLEDRTAAGRQAPRCGHRGLVRRFLIAVVGDKVVAVIPKAAK